jgi:alkylation response protein AidB-like acyl-CoA dehydrogenase
MISSIPGPSWCAGVGACIAYMLAGEIIRRKHAPDLPQEGLCGLAIFENEDLGLAEGRMDFSPMLRSGTVTGTKSSVFLAPQARRFAVFSGGPEGCRLAWTGKESARISEPVGLIGARALACADVAFDRAPALSTSSLGLDDLLYLLGLLSLFSSACACATAAEGLRKAWEYAAQRYQGGTTIDKHDAVALMYARNMALVESSLEAIAQAARQLDRASRQAALAGIRTKILATDVARSALSDAIQMHGGYGYMRDYGVEKRFRDAVALSLLPADNTRLALLCARV